MVQATRAAGEDVLVGLWRVIRRLKSSAAALGGDPAALHVIHMVKEHGPLRLTALAEAATVSRHVQHLEAAGHLARTTDPDDRRATLIAVTESGQALLGEALAARGRLLDDALAGWPEADRAALARLLARLAEDMA
jgi:DNA-binding MarR family transcriptional regulator